MAKRQKLQCTATSKQTGERCKRWAAPGHTVCVMHGARGGAPPGNKNAVTTGEHEAIWYDVLPDEEKRVYRSIDTDKLKQLDDEIRLLSIRERRMLQRIESLRQKEFTVVEITEAAGTEKGQETNLISEKHAATLGQIQHIEEALTRVQAQKARFIREKHEIEEAARLAGLGTGQESRTVLADIMKALREIENETESADR